MCPKGIRSSFKVTSGHMRGAAATLEYVDEINTTGWGQIKLRTSGLYSDRIQARAAGQEAFSVFLPYSFIEGYVEHERIAQHVSNIRAINFKGKPIPEGIEKYLADQIEFIRKMVSMIFHYLTHYQRSTLLAKTSIGCMLV